MRALRYFEALVGVLFLVAYLWDGHLPTHDSPGVHEAWNILVLPPWMKVTEIALAVVLVFDALWGLRRMNNKQSHQVADSER